MTTGALEGRLALVTGAFGRLGPVWCEALLGAGATVVAVDREGVLASSALERLSGDRLIRETADVTDEAAVRSLADLLLDRYGPVHILVNNAGIDSPPGTRGAGRIGEMSIDAFTQVLDVNVTGAFSMMQVFGSQMAHAGRGSIINVGSLYASVSPDSRFYDHLPGDPPFLKPPAYGASKAALVNLTRYFATHWGTAGVRVNALSPGGVEGGQDPEFRQKFTSRVPLARMAQASDLTGPLLFLAGDASAYVTGIDLRVDGGFTAW